MRKEKVTMKDVADKLDLSLATVSYVLNRSDKEKISHSTRMKVIETAKSMGYVPCHAVKSTAKSCHLAGIIVNLNSSASSYMKFQSLDLAGELQSQLYKIGYDTVLSVSYDGEDIPIKYKHTLDAIFVIDLSEKSLTKLTKHYYIPIIFLDCDFEEGLFYKIMPDYRALVNEAVKILGEPHPFLVMDSVNNKIIRDQLTESFAKDDVFIYKNNSNLKEFLSQRISRKGIIVGDLLAVQVERYIDNNDIVVLSSNNANDLLLADTKRIIVSSRHKAEIAVEVLNKLLNLEYEVNTSTRLLLLPD